MSKKLTVLILFFVCLLAFGIAGITYVLQKKNISLSEAIEKSPKILEQYSPELAATTRSVVAGTTDFTAFDNVSYDDLRAYKINESLSTSILATTDDILVNNSEEFLSAIKNALPGQSIYLRKGIYRISEKRIDISRPGSIKAPIKVTTGFLGEVVIEMDSVEGFYVSAPHWVFENLDIRGVCDSHEKCEHAFHIVGHAKNTVIRNNFLVDFNAAIKINSLREGESKVFPDHGVIEKNTIYNQSARLTDSPVTPIDAVAVSNWVVKENFIADFLKLKGNKISYGAFFKGAGEGNEFSRNFVACQFNQQAKDETVIGFSFGGGGTSSSVCRDNLCTFEHNRGFIHHNVIMNCNDVGIYLNKSKNSEIYNNNIVNTMGIDVRFAQSNAVITNNIITGRIQNRDQGKSTMEANFVEDMDALEKLFANPKVADFRLREGDALLDRGRVLAHEEKDFCGNNQGPRNVDIGAVEYARGNSICHPLGTQTF